MKVFIFHSISQVSNRYHSNGGLVIIAKTKKKAIELISLDKEIQPDESDWEKCEVYSLEDKTIEPKYWVMPNAGCC